jgi:hypothetical protein
VPVLKELGGWQLAFGALAIGPVLGIFQLKSMELSSKSDGRTGAG